MSQLWLIYTCQIWEGFGDVELEQSGYESCQALGAVLAFQTRSVYTVGTPSQFWHVIHKSKNKAHLNWAEKHRKLQHWNKVVSLSFSHKVGFIESTGTEGGCVSAAGGSALEVSAGFT